MAGIKTFPTDEIKSFYEVAIGEIEVDQNNYDGIVRKLPTPSVITEKKINNVYDVVDLSGLNISRTKIKRLIEHPAEFTHKVLAADQPVLRSLKYFVRDQNMIEMCYKVSFALNKYFYLTQKELKVNEHIAEDFCRLKEKYDALVHERDNLRYELEDLKWRYHVDEKTVEGLEPLSEDNSNAGKELEDEMEGMIPVDEEGDPIEEENQEDDGDDSVSRNESR